MLPSVFAIGHCTCSQRTAPLSYCCLATLTRQIHIALSVELLHFSKALIKSGLLFEWTRNRREQCLPQSSFSSLGHHALTAYAACTTSCVTSILLMLSYLLNDIGHPYTLLRDHWPLPL